MEERITSPAIRIKLTGVCNRTCSFCHEEGDMRTIGEVAPDAEFFECVRSLTERVGIERVMLTGGEPTLHPRLTEIVAGVRRSEVSITSNGIRPIPIERWADLKKVGLTKLILSIHDASIQPLLSLETTSRSVTWAFRALDAQQKNLINASDAGLAVRVNTVVYHSAERTLEVLRWLASLQARHAFEIRLLNDLSKIETSRIQLERVCTQLGAEEIEVYRRAGSSNVTRYFRTPEGFRFSTKVSYPYFFAPICQGCPIQQSCHEGFYGIRLERRGSEYFVRLCIYKHEPDVLMSWRDFLAGSLPDQMRDVLARELS